MSLYVVLALLNGMVVALSRALNGRLSAARGPFFASYTNHWVGFALLSLLLVLLSGEELTSLASAPWYSWTGGLIGAMYVAVNSFVLTRLGVSRAALLVISGQMVFGVIIDLLKGLDRNMIMQLSGLVLIVLGIILSQQKTLSKQTKIESQKC